MNLTVEPQRLIAAALITLFWIGWVWWILRRADYRDQMGRSPTPDTRSEAPVLVAFASQTGVANALALRSAEQLRGAGLAVRLEPLGRVEPDDLLAADRALFLVSTCGEGDAPDDAFGFVRRMSRAGPRLDKVRFAVLALGDRKYSNFCAFGRRLESWLLGQGAQALAERIDVDGHDLTALARWDALLPGLVGVSLPGATPPSYESAAASSLGSPLGSPLRSSLASQSHSPFAPAAFTPWRLVLRETMNPKSAGEPVLRLRLAAPAQSIPPAQSIAPSLGSTIGPSALASTDSADSAGSAEAQTIWQAGDLVEIEVPTEGLPALREFSIASIPEEGAVELFVRLQRGPDGELGLASRWLSGGCPQRPLAIGETVPLRLRANPNFRLRAGAREPLILIGAGSGLAGLRSLIKARERAGAHRNWLIFGERNRAHDFLCSEEIERWHAEDVLERFDPVFSRDDVERRYVQHRLHEQASELRRWVDDGAWVHVCGSRERLGLAVDKALEQILGEAVFDELRQAGRYRRDVW